MALQFCLWLGNKGDTSNARDWERPEACLWQQGQEEAGAVERGGGGPESDTLDCCGSAPGKQDSCWQMFEICSAVCSWFYSAGSSFLQSCSVSSGVKLCRNKSEIHTLE